MQKEYQQRIRPIVKKKEKKNIAIYHWTINPNIVEWMHGDDANVSNNEHYSNAKEKKTVISTWRCRNDGSDWTYEEVESELENTIGRQKKIVLNLLFIPGNTQNRNSRAWTNFSYRAPMENSKRVGNFKLWQSGALERRFTINICAQKYLLIIVGAAQHQRVRRTGADKQETIDRCGNSANFERRD
ncbi:hypothetical protein RFI_25877 [Reticulomyxa filosa]|uniref:Uncharacterized protein n=1 Tax=Reticulomyxa filosa TaxID=46433 RepID=X6MBW1_RETFI|nr:hypothetical protein RFI_25877 [Reticulomyxa filosa]|eukprot:ETO11498.1 hypothetical protein RFI_25877 [Reticulomyxa filosa]